MSVQKVIAFASRHVWAATAASLTAIVVSICGFVLAVTAWMHGWYLAGYFGAAVSGDILIWGVIVTAALWLPGRRRHIA